MPEKGFYGVSRQTAETRKSEVQWGSCSCLCYGTYCQIIAPEVWYTAVLSKKAVTAKGPFRDKLKTKYEKAKGYLKTYSSSFFRYDAQ